MYRGEIYCHVGDISIVEDAGFTVLSSRIDETNSDERVLEVEGTEPALNKLHKMWGRMCWSLDREEMH